MDLQPVKPLNLLDLFDIENFYELLRHFADSETGSLRTTCTRMFKLSLPGNLPPEFVYLPEDNLDTVLRRIHKRMVVSGVALNPLSVLCYWEKAHELFVRFLLQARDTGVLSVEPGNVWHGQGVLGWDMFDVVEGMELEWHAQVLKFARETALFREEGQTRISPYQCNPPRYNLDPEDPTKLVHQLLIDLGFRVAGRFQKKMDVPKDLSKSEVQEVQCNNTYYRSWFFNSDFAFREMFRQEVYWTGEKRKREESGCGGPAAKGEESDCGGPPTKRAKPDEE